MFLWETHRVPKNNALCSSKDGNTEKDYFFIDATISLIPIVSSISPTSGTVGDAITIMDLLLVRINQQKVKLLLMGRM